ncbi:MAG: TlpA disulfide reductase family protein, partial [Solirubrobacterales bacterium]
CKAESPALDRFEEKNRDRIVVLGIDTKDLSEDAMNFIREFNIKYPQFRDASGDYTDQKLKTTGVPESFLIDPEGNLVAHFPGPFEDEAAIEEFAAPALESEANVDPAGVTGQNGPAGGSAKPEAASP